MPFSQQTPMPLVVIAGYTGSGKTEILRDLHSKGQQVINLEALASHNGSVFGHLPNLRSPSSFFFHKALARIQQKFDWSLPVFCENKSLTLGHLQIPGWLFRQMQSAPTIWLNVKKEIRLQRILSAYGKTDTLAFKEALRNLSKQLSARQSDDIARFYEQGLTNEIFKLLMEYYDDGLNYQKGERMIIGEIDIEEWNQENITTMVMRFTESRLTSFSNR